MDYLYETQTDITLKEYLSFSKNPYFTRTLIISCIICDIIIIVYGIIAKMPAFIIFAVLLSLLTFVRLDFRLKKTYKSNKMLQSNSVATYKFYDTYFEMNSSNSTSKINYTDIIKIIETKINIYLMIGRNQGCILVKDNLPAGLEAFIKDIKKRNAV